VGPLFFFGPHRAGAAFLLLLLRSCSGFPFSPRCREPHLVSLGKRPGVFFSSSSRLRAFSQRRRLSFSRSAGTTGGLSCPALCVSARSCLFFFRRGESARGPPLFFSITPSKQPRFPPRRALPPVFFFFFARKVDTSFSLIRKTTAPPYSDLCFSCPVFLFSPRSEREIFFCSKKKTLFEFLFPPPSPLL